MSEYKGLLLQRPEEHIEAAKMLIRSEATGEQTGLYCRYDGLNIAMMKYFRFGNVNIIAGRSGSGKSLLYNILRNDFSNGLLHFGKVGDIPIHLGKAFIQNTDGSKYYPESRVTVLTNGEMVIYPLNTECIHDVVLVHFGYEMSAVAEDIRTAASYIGKSYSYMLSSKYDVVTKMYNTLTREEIENIELVLDCFKPRKEYYASSSGTLLDMHITIDEVQNSNPNSKLVIGLDHALLTKRSELDPNTEIFVANLAQSAVDIKKNYDAMYFILLQLNNEIEKPERKRDVNMHYPSKVDLHYGSQIWWAADNAMVIHTPEKLGLEFYGKHGIPTKDMAHLAIIKQRYDDIGNIWFRAELNRGRFHEATFEAIKKGNGATIKRKLTRLS